MYKRSELRAASSLSATGMTAGLLPLAEGATGTARLRGKKGTRGRGGGQGMEGEQVRTRHGGQARGGWRSTAGPARGRERKEATRCAGALTAWPPRCAPATRLRSCTAHQPSTDRLFLLHLLLLRRRRPPPAAAAAAAAPCAPPSQS